MAAFRFGVQLSEALSGSAWRDRAKKLEDLGYSTLFIPDHLGSQWAPMVALTAAVEATTTLKVGTLVLDNDYRHPVMLAKEAATLDLISRGRFELGIGAGWMITDYEQSGIDYDSAGVRVSRLEEGIQILKGLWSGKPFSFEGKYYNVTEAVGGPAPHTPGGPRVIIGGGSPRVLKLAVECADIIGVNPSLKSGKISAEAIASTSPSAYAERIGWIKEAAGERFGSLELQSLVFLAQLGRPQSVIAEEMSGLFGYPPEEVAASSTVLIGTEDEIVETLQQRRQELGFSYWVLHEAEIESFAPVVARLAGT